MKMKEYVVPTIKVKKIEMETILAGSNPASSSLDDKDKITSPDEIEAKENLNGFSWDDEAEED